jgi:hypothetical protein
MIKLSREAFTAHKEANPNNFGMMPVGYNVGVITACAHAEKATTPHEWLDETTTMSVTVKNADNKTARVYLYFDGFKKREGDELAPKGFEFMSSEGNNEQYLVNSKTKKRVIDEENQTKALYNVAEVIEHAGEDLFAVLNGTESVSDLFNRAQDLLMDKTVGVFVKVVGEKADGKNQYKTRIIPAENALAQIEKAAMAEA